MKELRSQGQISQQNKLSFCFRKIPLPHGVWARGVWSLTHNVGSDGKVLAIRAVAFGGGTGCRVEKCSRGRTSKSISEFFSSVAQSCPTLCDPMDCSTPGLPVHHQLPELAQIHVHRVGDAIQSSHPLSSSSPPSIRVFSNRISSSHEVTKVLEFQPQHQSFQ